MREIDSAALKRLLLADGELALIDVREQGAFAEAHLLFASCVPLSRMEMLVGDLVPRLDTAIVVVGESGSDDLARRACGRLGRLGYTDVRALEGGVRAWQESGCQVFSGVNVPSKAFGEFVEETYGTPRLTALEVKEMLDEGCPVAVVDARPLDEYRRMNIPSSTDVPGAELALRIHDVAPDPDTMVVVNCAGRTRSIIGAQSLVNAGIPNPVAALKDGTMGWHLAGLDLEHGAARVAPLPGTTGSAKARAAAQRVAERFGVQTVSAATLDAWRLASDRTTYCLDVRSPEEYAAGHLAGFRHAPGGQLVQATDEYVAVRNARLVLADDLGVRATMTASWLIQMGWRDVYVLDRAAWDDAEPVQQAWSPTVLGTPGAATVTTEALAAQLASVRVIDVGPSPEYERHHIPGAVWCVRARLSQAAAEIPAGMRVVLTSPDGTLARLGLDDVSGLEAEALEGGTARWRAEGRATESGLTRLVGPTDDVWYKPYEQRGAPERFMRAYLTWEVALPAQIAADGTARFQAF